MLRQINASDSQNSCNEATVDDIKDHLIGYDSWKNDLDNSFPQNGENQQVRLELLFSLLKQSAALGRKDILEKVELELKETKSLNADMHCRILLQLSLVKKEESFKFFSLFNSLINNNLDFDCDLMIEAADHYFERYAEEAILFLERVKNEDFAYYSAKLFDVLSEKGNLALLFIHTQKCLEKCKKFSDAKMRAEAFVFFMQMWVEKSLQGNKEYLDLVEANLSYFCENSEDLTFVRKFLSVNFSAFGNRLNNGEEVKNFDDFYSKSVVVLEDEKLIDRSEPIVEEAFWKYLFLLFVAGDRQILQKRIGDVADKHPHFLSEEKCRNFLLKLMYATIHSGAEIGFLNDAFAYFFEATKSYEGNFDLKLREKENFQYCLNSLCKIYGKDGLRKLSFLCARNGHQGEASLIAETGVDEKSLDLDKVFAYLENKDLLYAGKSIFTFFEDLSSWNKSEILEKWDDLSYHFQSLLGEYQDEGFFSDKEVEDRFWENFACLENFAPEIAELLIDQLNEAFAEKPFLAMQVFYLALSLGFNAKAEIAYENFSYWLEQDESGLRQLEFNRNFLKFRIKAWMFDTNLF